MCNTVRPWAFRCKHPGKTEFPSFSLTLIFSYRFQTLGLHPELLTRVKGQSPANVAPGSYDLLQYSGFSEKNVQKRAQGPNWQQALYTEQMAKIPHSTYKETHEKHKEEERRVGPGAYVIHDFLEEAERRPRCNRGALDQLTPRFAPDPAERAPPPGAYGVPDEKFVATRWQQGSNIPPFEWHQGPRTLPLQVISTMNDESLMIFSRARKSVLALTISKVRSMN